MFSDTHPLLYDEEECTSARDLLLQSWAVDITTHPRVKSIQPSSFTLGSGFLNRTIKTHLTHRETPYLALFKDLLESVEIVKSYTYLPHIVSEHMDTVTEYLKLQEYLRKPRIELEILGMGLASLFVIKTYTMFRGGTVHPEFSSLEEQREASTTLLVAFSKFLKNRLLTDSDIDSISPWVQARLDIPEIFGKMRSYIGCIQLLTSPNTLCHSVDVFVDSVDYFHDLFDSTPDECVQNSRSLLGDFSSLSQQFERGSLKKLSKNRSNVFTDLSRKYVFKSCDPIVDNFYTCMELYVDYLISRILEDCLPNCKNFAKTFVCVKDAKINNDSIFEARPTVPRLMISPRIDGGTLYGMILNNKVGDDVVLDCLLEVFGALQEAYEACELTHYDLHSGNVLLETCQPYSWKWRGYSSRIQRMVRPVVIDFGRSRVVYHDKVLCRPWSPVVQDYLSISTDRPYPAHDIFRLLQSCYSTREIPVLEKVLENIFQMSMRELDHSFGTAMYSMPYADRYAPIQYKDAVQALLGMIQEN